MSQVRQKTTKAVDSFQGNFIDRDYFKIPVHYCILTNERCYEDSWRLDEQAYYRENVEGQPPFDCRVCVRSRDRRNPPKLIH